MYLSYKILPVCQLHFINWPCIIIIKMLIYIHLYPTYSCTSREHAWLTSGYLSCRHIYGRIKHVHTKLHNYCIYNYHTKSELHVAWNWLFAVHQLMYLILLWLFKMNPDTCTMYLNDMHKGAPLGEQGPMKEQYLLSRYWTSQLFIKV